MNSQQDSKIVVIKTLAIVGFFATLALVVWLVVQGVRYAPSAFSSLASIAENIQNYRPTNELTVATEKSIVNSGESFVLSWTDMRRAGEYVFTYPCAEGVSLNVRGADGYLVTMPCAESLILPENVHRLFVSINSEKERFIEVPLILSFRTTAGDVVVTGDTKMTVVNAVIPVARREVTTTPTALAPTTSRETQISGEPTAKPTSPQKTQVVTQNVPAPKVTETQIAYIPTSDPLGYTDLKVGFVGVGTMADTTFIPSATYDPQNRGALRFEVRNVGTKTSGPWSFVATLPSDFTYASPEQAPLLPNERAIFTLGFTMDPSTKDKYARLGVTVLEKTDANKTNDSFTWSVEIKD